MKKSREQVEMDMVVYLRKTSQHLFTDETGKLRKITPFRYDDKWYMLEITFYKGKVSLYVKEVLSDNTYGWYGSNSLRELKQSLFPVYNKTRSIKHFKSIRKILFYIRTRISNNYDGTKESLRKFEEKIMEDSEKLKLIFR